MKNKKFNSKLRLLLIWFIVNVLSPIICSNYISLKIINYSNQQINKIPDNSFSIEDFMKTKIQNPIYTKIKIGEPPQEVITWINSEEYSYFIFKDTCLIESNFDENGSSTFEPNFNNNFFYKGYGKAIYINETILLNNDINTENTIKIKKFPIMFMKDPKNDEFFMQRYSDKDITGKTCATIGFRHTTNFQDNISKNFLLVLKDKDIIDDYIIFFIYDKNGDEQYLIMGGYPEDIYNKKKEFILENQKVIHIKLYNRFKPQWGFKCDKILSGNEKINKEEIAFHHDLGVIYGPKDYQDHIERKFFNYYFNLKICDKKINDEYTIFYCHKEQFTLEEMRKFPELQFVKTEIEESFNLTYQDLFFEKGNNVYFLIVFNHLYDEIWELGKPFLKKFIFSYNFDSKLIRFYKNLGDIANDNLRNFSSNNKLIYAIVLLSVCLGIICFLFGRKLYNNRKTNLIKAKELEQNFSYHENINKNENRLIEE